MPNCSAMIDSIQKALLPYDVRVISDDNYLSVSDIYHSNNDYFRATNGKPADDAEIQKDIRDVPPGFSWEDKCFISIWEKGKVIAVLDFLPAYPTKEDVWIGFLLVSKDMQKQGVGRRVARAFFSVAKEYGFSSVQLGVMNVNKKAFGFWCKMGFRKCRETTLKTGKTVSVMKRKL